MCGSDIWMCLYVHRVTVGQDSPLVPSHIEHPVAPHSLSPFLLGSSPFLGCCPSHWTDTASLVIKVDEMQSFKPGIRKTFCIHRIDARTKLTLNSSGTSVIAENLTSAD